jgi:peptide/nickel transport system permease protein
MAQPQTLDPTPQAPPPDTPPSEDPAPEQAGGRRRKRKRGGLGLAFWLAVGWLSVVAVCSVGANWLPVDNPSLPDMTNRFATPSADSPMGTDALGRDQLARAVHGAQISMTMALAAITIGVVVGGTIGVLVGYVRGWTETIIMGINDIILAFPGLLILLVLTAYMDRSLTVLALGIGCLSIPIYARVSRANTLAISQREFVHAAATLGAKRRRILFREIVPNVILPVLAYGLVAMGVVIVLEGALAFLGLSVEDAEATWGGMISDGRNDMKDHPMVVLMPALVLFLTVLSLNFVGDTLRRKVDVKDSGL